MKTIAAIDLFAGPGGLNEGFGRYSSEQLRFDVKLSIEKDPVACRTLRLRAFYRQFEREAVPKAYYDYIRGEASKLAELEAMPQWEIARRHVRQWNLGSSEGTEGYVSATDLHLAINDALRGSGGEWVLLGGPPCQAYSLIGRARMIGVGAKVRKANDAQRTEASRKERELAFADDHRHTLYREYLRVVAVHQPAAFVMENVKGMLSARLPLNGNVGDKHVRSPKVFDQIHKDLRDPWTAIALDPDVENLKELNQRFKRGDHTYRLYSFVMSADDAWAGLDGKEFLIKAEEFGVPQARHRVILLGVRTDLKSTHKPLETVKEHVSVRTAIKEMPRLRSGISRKDAKTINRLGGDTASNWHAALRDAVEVIVEDTADKKLRKTLKQYVTDAESAIERGGAFVKCKDTLSELPSTLRQFIRDPEIGGVIQHVSRSHMASDLARYLFLAAAANKQKVEDQQTPTLYAWPKSLLPKHANVRHQGPKRVVDGFTDRFRVQVWDRPSSTIMSHLQKDGHYFIHPDPAQCRCLTVREAARLQTFPENYFFEGNTTQQFLQVGNAVPPYLAVQLARSVANLFKD
jgi:DNA (cytosine-5)-methyltransferase 1